MDVIRNDKNSLILFCLLFFVFLFFLKIAEAEARSVNFSSSSVKKEDKLNIIEKWKVIVNKPGIYKLTYDDLTAAGINLSNVRPENITITRRETEIPIYISAQNREKFTPKDYIEFYGEYNTDSAGNRDFYTDENVYWLTFSDKTGKRMQIISSSLSTQANYYETSSPRKAEAFLKNVRKAYEIEYRYFLDLEEKFPKIWYMFCIRAPSKVTCAFFDYEEVFYVANTNLYPKAQIRIGLQGDSRLPVNPDHHAIFSFNNHKLGEAWWDGRTPYVFETTIPSSYLKETGNFLVIEAPGDIKHDPPIDVFLVDFVEIDYYKEYKAWRNFLEFTSPGSEKEFKAGRYEFKIANFTIPNVEVYNITEGRKIIPKVIGEGKSSNKYIVSFIDDLQAPAKYIAIPEFLKKKPIKIEKYIPSDLKDTTNQADYIIITYDEFESALKPLVEWRTKQGYRTKVVKISEIYNEFNYGIFNPEAIRTFLSYAYHNWKEPKPKYVFLVGDANWDFRDNRKRGAKNFVPTYLYYSPRISHIASDNWFVSVDEKEAPYPVMAIGRLTAQKKEDVKNYIKKIIEFETKSALGMDYDRARVLLIADRFDWTVRDCEELARLTLSPNYELVKAYTLPMPSRTSKFGERDEVTHNKIVQAINEGVYAIYYTGHSCNSMWTDRKIFLTEDINKLNNQGKYPLVFSMTCFSSRFEEHWEDGIGEYFVKAKDKGAIAFWGDTGRSWSFSNMLLAREVFKSIFLNRERILGDILKKAKRVIKDRDMIEGYTLFGDPLLHLSLPEENLALKTTLSSSSGSENTNFIIEITGNIPEKIDAKGHLKIFDSKGDIIYKKEIVAKAGEFRIEINLTTEKTPDTKELRIRAYLFNSEVKKDWVGYTTLKLY